MDVELRELSSQEGLNELSEGGALELKVQPPQPPTKSEQQEMPWAIQAGSVSQQVSDAYSAALAMASAMKPSLPSFPTQPNATAKAAPMSPFRVELFTGPPAPLWAQAYSELSVQQLAKADAAPKISPPMWSSKKGEPPKGQALVGKLKVLKGHEDLMSIRIATHSVATLAPRELRADPAVAAFLGESSVDIAERTLDDVLVAGIAATEAADAPRWIKQVNITQVILTATRGPQNRRRAAAVAALAIVFQHGQSTEEGVVGERMSSVLGRLLTAGSGRLRVDAVADLIEGRRPYSLLERAADAVISRGGRRKGIYPVDPAAQLAGLRLLRLLLLCKDAEVLERLCAHERLCTLISTLEDEAYRAMQAARAAAPNAKGLDAPGRYQGFKPQVYTSAQLSSLVAAGMGLRKWRPRVKGQKGLRILSLDGGGTRGVLTVGLLKQIVKAAGGLEIYEAFDMVRNYLFKKYLEYHYTNNCIQVVGTSTGAIVAVRRCWHARM
jgi:hypothetical protein